MSNLHERLDEQHTESLQGNYSSLYQDWLEEEIEALWCYIKQLHCPAAPTEMNESTNDALQALSEESRRAIEVT